MAKSKVNNDEDEVKVIIPETSNEETTEEPAADVAAVAKVTTEKKKVKIRVMEDVDCLIACVPYQFTKDKEVAVPSDVAAILCYAKKAYRL